MTESEIQVYDASGSLKVVYGELKIKNCISVSETHMFCIQEAMSGSISFQSMANGFSKTYLQFGT